jgi:hypothetical protein
MKRRMQSLTKPLATLLVLLLARSAHAQPLELQTPSAQTQDAQATQEPRQTPDPQAAYPKAAFTAEPSKSETRNWAFSIERSLSVPTEVSTKAATVPVPGLGLTYRFSERVGVQLILAAGYMQSSSTTPVTTEESQTAFSAAGRLHVQVLQAGSFRLGLLAGGGYRGAFGSTNAGGATRTQTTQGFGLELGVRPEFFLSERVSVHTAVGPVFRWSRENNGNTAVGFALAGDVIAQLGLSIWL